MGISAERNRAKIKESRTARIEPRIQTGLLGDFLIIDIYAPNAGAVPKSSKTSAHPER
jgi:hypothetical protein